MASWRSYLTIWVLEVEQEPGRQGWHTPVRHCGFIHQRQQSLFPNYFDQVQPMKIISFVVLDNTMKTLEVSIAFLLNRRSNVNYLEALGE